jgi:thiosulfate dehydrogenase
MRRLAWQTGSHAAIAGLALFAAGTANALDWPYVQRPTQATALTGLAGTLQAEPIRTVGTLFIPPRIADLPDDSYGNLVKLGRNIFTDTQRFAPRFAGNGLNCSSCHLSEGRKPDAAPLWGAYPMYPSYRGKNEQVNTFEMRIQDCFRFSVDGLMPPLESPELRAVVAYAQWLATGAQVGKPLPGKGFVKVRRDIEPSPDRGKVVYEKKCAVCHGLNGRGVKRADGVGYQFPPVWGPESFNRGAGMFTVRTAAAYIKGNMPLGRPMSLPDQEAYDVALYIRLQVRPQDPRIGFMSDWMRMMSGL